MPKLGARRRMLLLCAGVAIALAGVQVHWLGPEGGMTAPVVAALISIALAGALVALAVMTPTAKHEAAIHPKVRETREETFLDLAAQDAKVFCNSQLDDYFAGIKGELSQVDRLVGDAVGNLVASFKYISKLTRSHQETAQAIGQTATPADREPTEQLLHRRKAIADQIEQELDAAVTSLQFGDLVAQLLGHTMIRVEALGVALLRIDGQHAGQESDELSCEPLRIHERISRAVTVANATSRRKPVVQQGMQTGDIELF